MTIRTRAATDAYRAGWDRLFGRREAAQARGHDRGAGGAISQMRRDLEVEFFDAEVDAALRGVNEGTVAPDPAPLSRRRIPGCE